ncbi:hypothetical protein HDV05_002721 [Chytridiales sp. JEL 0842]|nr:hypothetical protein HDV05_002721 [Chytridiales sp. JEL 0842]
MSCTPCGNGCVEFGDQCCFGYFVCPFSETCGSGQTCIDSFGNTFIGDLPSPRSGGTTTRTTTRNGRKTKYTYSSNGALSTLSTGALVGIVIAGLVFFGLLYMITRWWRARKMGAAGGILGGGGTQAQDPTNAGMVMAAQQNYTGPFTTGNAPATTYTTDGQPYYTPGGAAQQGSVTAGPTPYYTAPASIATATVDYNGGSDYSQQASYPAEPSAVYTPPQGQYPNQTGY